MNDNLDTIRDYIREMIIEELTRQLEEDNSTGSVGGEFLTPKAFKKTDDNDEELLVKKSLSEGRSLYHDVRDSRGTPARKIGLAVSDINRKLLEIDKILSAYARLKSENDMDYNAIWKRTARHLGNIERTILSIARRLKELKT
jgi:hypothetical protein